MAFPQKNPQCSPDQLLQTHSETQGLEVAQESKALEEACLSSHPEMPGNLKEAPDAGIPSTSESAQSSCSSSVVTTVSSSGKYGEGSSSEEEEDSTLEADPDPRMCP
ncbi:Melanoma-associated antigen B16 [Myotis brandtii]|uniref:Melanoma-associated antigen B16 n=1 Tax=Myotis brandtii TaxID=109478 RepID=S7PQP4_MYOBR|nr:Melanoma-associated antigen B16 [Myotis brandtii]